MKKVFALGVASLVMLGTASQASAAFEQGNFILSVYDITANQEMGIDLGAISQTELQTANLNKVLATGLNFSNFTFNAPTSGIGIFAWDSTKGSNPIDAGTYEFGGYFATTNNSGTAVINKPVTEAISFFSTEKAVRGAYKTEDSNQDGIAFFAADFASSYNILMNSTQPGGYAGMQGQVAVEAEYKNYVEMYIYQFATDTSTLDYDNMQINYGGPVNGVAKIVLTNDGQVILNPGTAPVPVPGAAWLLGAGLLGLAGIRRRKNS